MDNYYLSDIFRYKTYDKLSDFISDNFNYEEEILDNEEYDENNFYQKLYF